jgi:hypothetical protein
MTSYGVDRIATDDLRGIKPQRFAQSGGSEPRRRALLLAEEAGMAGFIREVRCLKCGETYSPLEPDGHTHLGCGGQVMLTGEYLYGSVRPDGRDQVNGQIAPSSTAMLPPETG